MYEATSHADGDPVFASVMFRAGDEDAVTTAAMETLCVVFDDAESPAVVNDPSVVLDWFAAPSANVTV